VSDNEPPGSIKDAGISRALFLRLVETKGTFAQVVCVCVDRQDRNRAQHQLVRAADRLYRGHCCL
jgi:hypothetical protein